MIQRFLFSVVGVLFLMYLWIFKLPSDRSKGVEFEYDASEWVTTSGTVFTTDILGVRSSNSSNTWELLPKGMQLVPVMKYYSLVMVDLPDGRRGLVAPTTLSGMKTNEALNVGFAGIDITSKLPSSVKSKITKDDSLRFVQVIDYKTAYDLTNGKSQHGKKLTGEVLPSAMIVAKDGVFYHTYADIKTVSFVEDIPRYSKRYRSYARLEDLEGKTMSEINDEYGEPQSVVINKKGEKIAYYEHLTAFDDVNYKGREIKFDVNGLSEPEKVTEKTEWKTQTLREHNLSWFTEITGVRWNILPLSNTIIDNLYFNLYKISYVDEPFDMNDGNTIIGILFLFFIAYLIQAIVLSICVPIKKLSNTSIYFILVGAIFILMYVVGILVIETSNNVCLLMFIALFFAVVASVNSGDHYVEFNRCDNCRLYGTLTHTKTLTEVYSDYIKRSKKYSEKELSDSYIGPTRKVDAENARDFDDWNRRETTDYREDIVDKETTKVYRYDFTCSACSHKWHKFEKVVTTKEVSRKTSVTGGKVETVRRP
ncbi:MAG: hypothetical protein R3Y51_00550 [Rikenellaceae bacterium]